MGIRGVRGRVKEMHVHSFLQLQMSGLLMMSGRACDGERLESLQRQLSHARSELCEVTEKLHKYEKKEVREQGEGSRNIFQSYSKIKGLVATFNDGKETM